MANSSSFSSLLALVDDHLSKTSIQDTMPDNIENSGCSKIQIPSLHSGLNGCEQSNSSISFAPVERFRIPSLNSSDSPITSVLAEQIANMLKAKELEKQREEEKRRLAAEMEKLNIEENANDAVIDLMQALKTPCGPFPLHQEALSSSSSLESLFEPKFNDSDTEPQKVASPEPILPCKQDMSYILFQKIKRGKCSPFGKVLTSRLRRVAAPYLHEKIGSTVVRFDFSTKSPCDLVKEKLRRV